MIGELEIENLYGDLVTYNAYNLQSKHIYHFKYAIVEINKNQILPWMRCTTIKKFLRKPRISF
uniref:Uncharacterized protein n=1 Tax=Octopus bimaculoides TaxID=37653 RepID=A0A0L8FKG9_OCTBM